MRLWVIQPILAEHDSQRLHRIGLDQDQSVLNSVVPGFEGFLRDESRARMRACSRPKSDIEKVIPSDCLHS